MHLLSPLEAPKVTAYGQNYKLYLEHYKLYRSTVEDLRLAASTRDQESQKAKEKAPKPKSPDNGASAEKKPLTPEQVAGRKAHKLGLRRAKKERRRVRKLEAQAKIADLQKKISTAERTAAQANLAKTKAKAEVPLMATKVKIAEGVYVNAKAKAELDGIKIRTAAAQEKARFEVSDLKATTARLNALESLEAARFKLAASIDHAAKIKPLAQSARSVQAPFQSEDYMLNEHLNELSAAGSVLTANTSLVAINRELETTLRNQSGPSSGRENVTESFTTTRSDGTRVTTTRRL